MLLMQNISHAKKEEDPNSHDCTWTLQYSIISTRSLSYSESACIRFNRSSPLPLTHALHFYHNHLNTFSEKTLFWVWRRPNHERIKTNKSSRWICMVPDHTCSWTYHSYELLERYICMALWRSYVICRHICMCSLWKWWMMKPLMSREGPFCLSFECLITHTRPCSSRVNTRTRPTHT